MDDLLKYFHPTSCAVGALIGWLFYLRKRICLLEKDSLQMKREVAFLQWELKTSQFSHEIEEVQKKKRGRPPKQLEEKTP